MVRIFAAAMLIVGISTSTVRAAEGDATVTAAAVTAAVTPAPFITVPTVTTPSLSRPAALPLLYVSFAGLQAFDVYSTRTALSRGGAEANPLMQGVASNTTALTIAKAVGTGSVIMIAERLWKTNHKPAAIVTMVVANGLMSAVAINNARVIGQLR